MSATEQRFVIESRIPQDGEWVTWAEGYADANAAYRECKRLRGEFNYCDWRVRVADSAGEGQ